MRQISWYANLRYKRKAEQSARESFTQHYHDMEASIAQPLKSKEKRKYRFKAGTKALREIKKMQKSTEKIIPRAPFMRIVYEVLKTCKSDAKMSKSGMESLQEAIEIYCVDLLNKSNSFAIHARRKTIQEEDLKCAQASLVENAA